MFYDHRLWGILVLIADIWALVNILQSTLDTTKKVVWTLVVLFLPVLGVVLWFFLGPRAGKS